MFATDFPESNMVVDKPSDMTRDQCDPINVCKAIIPDYGTVTISCWKPTKEELEEIIKTGRVWCWHFGQYLQPHSLSGHNPFKEIPTIQENA